MPKINIKVSISDNTNNDSYEIKSIIQDEIIKYKEKDNTLVKYDLNKNILTRENDNLRMEYVFNKGNETEGTIFIKELNNNIKILINTNKLNRINNNTYEIELKGTFEECNEKFNIKYKDIFEIK